LRHATIYRREEEEDEEEEEPTSAISHETTSTCDADQRSKKLT
jgi:hypothetical protein